MQAIRIIVSEHRTLAAILHGMRYLAHDIRDRGAKPDFALLEAMLCYIETFPERFHHPEQDEFLFRRLRSRCPGAAPLIDRLRMEHQVGAEKLRTLEQALARYQQGQKDEFSDFLAAVEACASFHWQHMRVEETQLLPLAEKYLSVSDWEEIDAAFRENTDPCSMAGRETNTERPGVSRVGRHRDHPPMH